MRVAVLAAGGHTGRLVVEQLRARGAEPMPLVRRDVDVRERAAVAKAIAGADAVINLAGPFLANGLAPVEAAIDARVPYVDTTGEQAFMVQVHRELDARAREARVPIVNACAFEYALGDLATKLHFPRGGDALHVLYRPRSTAPSAGTKKSMMRVFAAPTLSYEKGKLERIGYGRYQRTFATSDGPRAGAAFAGGEVVTVPRHTPFHTVRTYFQTRPQSARVAKALGPLARALLRGPMLRVGDRIIDARHTSPRNERARGEIHLVAEPTGTHVVVGTPDPYVVTAHVAAEGALRLAAAAGASASSAVRASGGGVLAPAEAFDAQEMLASLASAMPGFGVSPLSGPE